MSSVVDNTVQDAQNSQIKAVEEKDIIEPDKLIRTPLDEALSVASQWLRVYRHGPPNISAHLPSFVLCKLREGFPSLPLHVEERKHCLALCFIWT
jgi:hypothetical protein